MRKDIETMNKKQLEMKNVISELKNTLEGILNTLDEARNRISNLEIKVEKKLEKQKE